MRRAHLMVALGSAGLAGIASAALLGITFNGPPLLTFNDAGATTYDWLEERFAVDASPAFILFDGAPPAVVNGVEDLKIELRILNDGSLLAGVPNAPDLEISGDVQVPGGSLLSGVLLTGEILEYGSQDGEENSAFFDFRFAVTGGLLADPYFAGSDIGVIITSENSDFEDDFTVSFSGGGKGTVGPIDRLLGESCCVNDEKLRAIELQYTGDDCEATTNFQEGKFECEDFGDLLECVYIRAGKKGCNSMKDDSIYFEGEVCIGENFVVDAANLPSPKDRLESNTRICIYASDPDSDGDGKADDGGGELLQAMEIHTSCSKPLATGDQFASTLLIACTPEGEPIEGSCCNFGKPRVLTMEYTADDCTATMHGQDSGKVECEDRCAVLPNPAYIIASKEGEDHLDHGHDKLFEGWVYDGQLFDIDAANRGKDELDSATHIFILDAPLEEGGQVCQAIEFHTSCSQPLYEGYQFGSALLISCIGSDEPVPGDCCAIGKPQVLEFLYTGEDCEFTNHSQDDGKVFCEGDPMDAATVYIIANEKENASEGKVWFAGSVGLDTSFSLDATNAGETKFPSSTWIHIFDAPGGTEIQTIEFHTSCSQPLHLGDTFGAAELIDCIDEFGNQAPGN